MTGELMLNSGINVYGVLGGPMGIITSGSYQMMKVLGAEDQIPIMQQNMLQNMNNGTFNMRGPIGGGRSGRNLRSRNPKF